MSLTVLTVAYVRSRKSNIEAIEKSLAEVDRGRIDLYMFQRVRRTHLAIVTKVEVGLSGQLPGVPCERLVAEDTLQALRRVFPREDIEIQSLTLDHAKDTHSIVSFRRERAAPAARSA